MSLKTYTIAIAPSYWKADLFVLEREDDSRTRVCRNGTILDWVSLPNGRQGSYAPARSSSSGTRLRVHG